MYSACTDDLNTGLTHSACTGIGLPVVGTPSNTRLTNSDRTGNIHCHEPGMKNKVLIDEISNGNDIVTQDIGCLQFFWIGKEIVVIL